MALASSTVFGCTATTDEESDDIVAIGSSASKLYVASTKVWPSPHIPACWEHNESEFATEKQWIRDALRNSWEAETNITFDGWGLCSTVPPSYAGIRVRIQNASGYTSGLGTSLRGVVNGVNLNSWVMGNGNCASGWSRERCVKSTAVHEFGHVLGFAHEQNRDDRTSSCMHAPAGSNGDTKVGDFDMASVMNYCNRVREGDSRLSATDIEGAQQFYGGPYSASTVSWGTNGSRYSVFVRGTDGHLWTRTWDSAWGEWQDIGTQLTGSPYAVSWAAGTKVSVFMRATNGQLRMRTWDGSWKAWQSFGSNYMGSPNAVSWNGGNNLTVFIRDANRHLWTRTYAGTWGAWLDIGTERTGTASAIATNGGTGLSVFSRGMDGHLWRRSSNGSAWAPWEDIGANVVGSPSAVATSGGNRESVFVNDSAGNLLARTWSGSWGAWENIGTGLTPNPAAVASPSGDGIDVISRGTDGQIRLRSWSGAWGAWQSHGTDMVGSGSAAHSNGGNSLNLFFLDSSEQIWVRTRSSSWGDWLKLGTQAI